MAVVGIDFGNNGCYISVARAGGIETIANDYSLRETPSFVSFGDKQRVIGVSSKSQFLTNLKQTVFGFKHMLGRKFKDPIVQQLLPGLPYEIAEGPNGQIQISVNYLGEKCSFTPQEVTAMLFTKLKFTAEEALKTKVKDVVISCPCYFTDRERRALLDAAAIAGLNVLKLMNDTTASALAYGIYKQDLPALEEKARNVVFVDVGHVGVQVAACSFNKGKLVMKSNSFRRGPGGAAFDKHLVRYFTKEFQKKTGLDAMSKPRAFLKLLTEVEKVKKQMSANTNMLPLGIECFMEEKDLNHGVDRATFEGMIEGELKELEGVLLDCLNSAEWKVGDVYSVEVIGGSSRVPAVKATIEKVFGKAPNTTLNADEVVSRGCALQCAILSPTFKVREFSVTDIQPYPVKLLWKAEGGEMLVFPKFSQVPYSKLITFYLRDNFVVDAMYDAAGNVPLEDLHIGRYEVGDIVPLPDGGNQKVKIKVRINLNGVFGVSSASLIEKQEIVEEVPMEVDDTVQGNGKAEAQPGKDEAKDESKNGSKDSGPQVPNDAEMKEAKPAPENKNDGDKMDVETNPKKEVKMVKQKKIVSKSVDLPVTSRLAGALSMEKLEQAISQEVKFNKQDVYESERLGVKNAVEEYIYEIRSKINDELEEYMEDSARADYGNQLEDSENWLYEEGEDCDKSVYVSKLKELKLIGEAAKKRKSEFEGRKAAVEALGHSLQMASKVVEAYKSGDEKYNHIPAEEMDKVVKEIEEKRSWLEKSCAALEKTSKVNNPTVLLCQFYQERDAFENFAKPILNKPKPKVEPPPPAPSSDDDKKQNGVPDPSPEVDSTAAPAAASRKAQDPPEGSASSTGGGGTTEKMDLD